jgi:hypothetical protein
VAKRHDDDDDDAKDEDLRREMDEAEEREFRWTGKRMARRPGTESMIGRMAETKKGGAALRCARCIVLLVVFLLQF